MKNKILLIISMMFIILFTQMSLAYATDTQIEEPYEVDSLSKLKQELVLIYNQNVDVGPESPEIQDLIIRTDPKVLNSFIEEKMDLINVAMESAGEKTGETIVDLGDGCYLKMGDNEMTVENGVTRDSTPGAQTLWKDYGSRKFTSTFEGYLGLGAFRLNICNHYTLSKSGISPRYVEAWGDGAGLFSISTGTINQPKKSAKEGETVSSNCIFKIRAEIAGAGIDKSFKMYNYIKCSEIDTVEKQVKVVQSWRGDYL